MLRYKRKGLLWYAIFCPSIFFSVEYSASFMRSPIHTVATLSLPSRLCQLAPEKYNNDNSKKKMKKNDDDDNDNDNTVKGLNPGVIS